MQDIRLIEQMDEIFNLKLVRNTINNKIDANKARQLLIEQILSQASELDKISTLINAGLNSSFPSFFV
jgi:hypothetical protein